MWVFTAELARSGIKIFGFRVVEPHHDGTPHWHGLFFVRKESRRLFRRIVAKHAVREEAAELGLRYALSKKHALDMARQMCAEGDKRKLSDIAAQIEIEGQFWHTTSDKVLGKIKARVTIKMIDWRRGTAAGYIAK